MAERIFDLNLKAVSRILVKEFGKDCIHYFFDISVHIWKIAAKNLNINVDAKFIDFIDKSVRPQDIEGFYRLTINKDWGEEEANADPDSIINKMINIIYNLVDEVEPEIEKIYKEYLNN